MHYPPYAFSKNNKKTIEPIKDPGSVEICKSDGFSLGDIDKVNTLYGCKGKFQLKYRTYYS